MAHDYTALVISDSHFYIYHAENVLRELRDEIDAVYHLGDKYEDLERLRNEFPGVEMIGVAGNCDFHYSVYSRNLKVLNQRIFLCHGHRFDVKHTYSTLIQYAREEGYRVALCGHTHKPHVEDLPDLLVLNPGAISETVPGKGAPYALLYLSENQRPQYYFGYSEEPFEGAKAFLRTRRGKR